MEKQRILIIDGFRFIAIVFVLVYHLTSPYVAHYPHTDFFLHFFKFGYLGVYFFFIISGFVINYTLENTANLLFFFRNRFARLFPAMVCCTILTYLIARWLNPSDDIAGAGQLRNILPSLTFTNPTLWSLAFNKPFHWINGSYWSLWVEVQFYVIASVIYYLDKASFLRNFLLASIFLIIIKYLPDRITGVNLKRYADALRLLTEIFNITFNMGWFCLGVLFFQLFKNFSFKINEFAIYGFAIIGICLVRDTFEFYTNAQQMLVSLTLMCLLFVLMIYWSNSLSVLRNRYITRIGRISYSIYLIHEVIGLILINKFSVYLGELSFLSPFIVMLIALAFAEISYRYYEQRMSSLLK